MDEVAGLHESINTVIGVSWAVPGAIIAVALSFAPFLLQLRRTTALGFGQGMGAVMIESHRRWLRELAAASWNPAFRLESSGSVRGRLSRLLRILERVERVRFRGSRQDALQKCR